MINILMNQKPGLTDSVSCPTNGDPWRNLHPQASAAKDITPLDRSIRQWRRSAALAMGLSKQEEIS